MSVRTSVSALAIAALLESVFAFGAQSAPIGEASSVVPASTYRRGDNERTLAIRDRLEQNDRIRTTGAGSTQVKFLDDTLLTIGPNSEILLDQFVYDGNRAQKATVEVVRGAMRFVSGTSDRRAYEIKTPVATIGVRGTVVDIGFVNGRWSFNPVDGTITATLNTTGETRTFIAGQPGFSIGPGGFNPINPQDAAALWRRLDGAHLALAKAAGQNPSAPQGAAAGGVTGGTPGGTPGGNQNQTNNTPGPDGTQGGPGSGSNSGPAFSTPPSVTVIATTGSTTGGAGATGVPVFTANPMSLLAVGGDESEVSFNIGPLINRGLSDLSSLQFDSTTGGLTAVTVKGTTGTTPDPDAGTLTRVGGQVAELYTDPSSTPLYQIGRWTNGRIVAVQHNQTILDETLSANQGLHYILFGYTNGLYDANNQIPFGKIVTYSLESATKPTWITGQSAPGTFTGQLAVAFGTLAVSYGLQANLAMAEGTIAIQTPGGVANPQQSGAVGSVFGGLHRSATTYITGSGSLCPSPGDCYGVVSFIPVSSNKVGVDYALNVFESESTNLIEGVAIFGSPTAPANPGSPYAKPLGSFVDLVGQVHIAPTQGLADVSGSTVSIKQFSDATETVTRQTAQVADNGSYKFIGWERWTNGTYDVTGGSNPGTKTVPADGGVHLIHGIGATPPFSLSGLTASTSVQYSLAGGTLPTVVDGSVAPGSLGTNSKLSVDFYTQKIGLDLFINIGAANYQMSTTGGAANPTTSSISFTADGIIAGGIPTGGITLVGGTAVGACTLAICTGGVGGFLSDYEATSAGLTYVLGNSTSNFISGAAAFGRVFPVSTVGAFGYGDPAVFANVPITLGRMQDFNSGAGSLTDMSVVPDSTKPATGLSVNAFNLEVDNLTTVYGWHRLDRTVPGISVDQGVIAGILGWERMTGTLHTHNSNSGGGPDLELNSNQGVHIIHGVAATNIPTNVNYTYNLVGGTSPTLADGSSAAGTLTSGQVGVNFSTTAPKFGVDLNVNMGSAGAYNLASSGGASSPSLNAPILHSTGTFGTTAANQVVATNTSGPNTVCVSGTCSAAVSGFLAGDQAKHLGIIYQFGNSSAPGKVVTGAAGFTR